MLLGWGFFSVLGRRVVRFLPLYKPWNANYHDEFPPPLLLRSTLMMKDSFTVDHHSWEQETKGHL